MRRRSLADAVLVGLVVLSGCTGLAPSEPEAPAAESDVRVEVSNDHDRAYVVTVGVAPAGHAGLAAEFANGTVREFPDATGIEDLPDAVVSRIVSLRPTGDDAETRVYRWSGAQGAMATFEGVPRNATVYYSVAYPNGSEPMRTLGRLTCGPRATLTTVALRINADGSIAASNDCAVAS